MQRTARQRQQQSEGRAFPLHLPICLSKSAPLVLSCSLARFHKYPRLSLSSFDLEPHL